MAKTQVPGLDHFFPAIDARVDLWRDLNRLDASVVRNSSGRGEASL